MIVGVSYHAGDCKCCAISQMIVGVSYHAGDCECWECLSDEQVRCKCWAKTYMMVCLTSMKKGWFCINSCDEKNHEIAPGVI